MADVNTTDAVALELAKPRMRWIMARAMELLREAGLSEAEARESFDRNSHRLVPLLNEVLDQARQEVEERRVQ